MNKNKTKTASWTFSTDPLPSHSFPPTAIMLCSRTFVIRIRPHEVSAHTCIMAKDSSFLSFPSSRQCSVLSCLQGVSLFYNYVSFLWCYELWTSAWNLISNINVSNSYSAPNCCHKHCNWRNLFPAPSPRLILFQRERQRHRMRCGNRQTNGQTERPRWLETLTDKRVYG
jgi:hypothetical protein